MPWVVDAPEYVVPNVVGMQKEAAIEVLSKAHLNPIEGEPRFNETYKKGEVFFQKPESGEIVKEGRRVYLSVSGGERLVKMPGIVGKTLRDATITIERFGLTVGEIENVQSEFPENTVISQSIKEGVNVPQGQVVKLRMSIGPKLGKIRVPMLVGKSLTEADRILRSYSLTRGEISYVNSPALLPNTIVIQYPAEGKLVDYGDSVSVVVASSKE